MKLRQLHSGQALEQGSRLRYLRRDVNPMMIVLYFLTHIRYTERMNRGKELNKVTCGDISQASNLVWELLCSIEDLKIDGRHARKQLSRAVDLRVFDECFAELRTKWLQEEIAAEKAAPRQRSYSVAESSHEAAIYHQQEKYCEY